MARLAHDLANCRCPCCAIVARLSGFVLSPGTSEEARRLAVPILESAYTRILEQALGAQQRLGAGGPPVVAAGGAGATPGAAREVEPPGTGAKAPENSGVDAPGSTGTREVPPPGKEEGGTSGRGRGLPPLIRPRKRAARDGESTATEIEVKEEQPTDEETRKKKEPLVDVEEKRRERKKDKEKDREGDRKSRSSKEDKKADPQGLRPKELAKPRRSRSRSGGEKGDVGREHLPRVLHHRQIPLKRKERARRLSRTRKVRSRGESRRRSDQGPRSRLGRLLDSGEVAGLGQSWHSRTGPRRRSPTAKSTRIGIRSTGAGGSRGGVAAGREAATGRPGGGGRGALGASGGGDLGTDGSVASDPSTRRVLGGGSRLHRGDDRVESNPRRSRAPRQGYGDIQRGPAQVRQRGGIKSRPSSSMRPEDLGGWFTPCHPSEETSYRRGGLGEELRDQQSRGRERRAGECPGRSRRQRKGTRSSSGSPSRCREGRSPWRFGGFGGEEKEEEKEEEGKVEDRGSEGPHSALQEHRHGCGPPSSGSDSDAGPRS